MADFVIHVGCRTEQGRRSNNEDRCVADPDRHVFLVADGMGGQEGGEEASGLAAEIIPRVVHDRLAAQEKADQAMQEALHEAHKAILSAGLHQNTTRKMGTTAVLAVQQQDQVWVAGIGDSPAYLVRGEKIEQLTLDHTVADALARNGTITIDQARNSPWRNVLYKFLGCAEMGAVPESGADSIAADGRTKGTLTDVRPFSPQAGDRLLLASDGLTNFITHDDLRDGARRYGNPQEWADVLVQMALDRGSRDNVTCIILAFDAE
jgi:protein phosphatase